MDNRFTSERFDIIHLLNMAFEAENLFAEIRRDKNDKGF